jgi:hypothetical protein
MSERNIKLKEPGAKPCPACGNTLEFTIHSQQFSEDCCEVWAVCKCGHRPQSAEAFEDVMGGCDDDNCIDAINLTWNSEL